MKLAVPLHVTKITLFPSQSLYLGCIIAIVAGPDSAWTSGKGDRDY